MISSLVKKNRSLFCGNFAYLRDILHGTLGVIHPKPDRQTSQFYLKYVMVVKTYPPFSELTEQTKCKAAPGYEHCVYKCYSHRWLQDVVGRAVACKEASPFNQTLLPPHPI